ncbi:MAG TPA: AI-2E family transporter [Dissulfurispiraceae bacterium]
MADKDNTDFAFKVFTALLISTMWLLLFIVVWYATEVVLLAFAGILMTIFLRTISTPIGRVLRIPDTLSVLLTLLILAGTAYLVISALIPHIMTQVHELEQKLPDAIQRLQEQIRQNPLGNELLGHVPDLGRLVSGGALLKEVRGVLTAAFGVIANLFIVFFISLYFSVNPGVYLRGVLRLVPLRKRERFAEIFRALDITLRRWLLGRLAGMAIIGIFTGIGLQVIGIPLALTFGLLAFILTFIPYLGAIISAAPAVLLGLLDRPAKALYVIILYLLVHTIEAYMVGPIIEQRQVRLPPALLITSQVLLGFAAGMLGIIFATPLVAAIMVVVKILYIEDVLGEKAGGLPGEK